MTATVGFKWLSEHTSIIPVQPFRISSSIGSSRRSNLADGVTNEVYSEQSRPASTVAAHLSFALKHEVMHLEFLSRLFHAIDPALLENWIRSESTGAYARRAGFLFEWLTGRQLDIAEVGGNYVDALPDGKYLTASRPVNIPRWRVRDNMPGTPDFCPVVYRTERVQATEQYDCEKALKNLEVKYGADLLMRSAVWLTIKESRASFAIEHEEKHIDRIKRFASVIEDRCGQGADPLEVSELTQLQMGILGRATRYGMRKSPVFVGHVSDYAQNVDYVAPHWENTESLLRGLQQFIIRTQTRSPIVRAAVASFGFVYIHPMADGNGRISRFLVNDILRRSSAIPAPFILPISATITNTSSARTGYDHTLEVFSKPLLRTYKHRYSFGKDTTYGDGVVSNFEFNAYDDALHAWKYQDLTTHAEYMGDIVLMTIQVEMRNEALYLCHLEQAREGVKNWLEGPNTDIDRIIRAIMQTGTWSVSNKLRKEFPDLADEKIAQGIIQAVREVFDQGSPDGGDETNDA